jgi:peptide deformylase
MRINYETIVKDTDPKLRNKSEPVEIPLKSRYLALAKRMLRYVKDSRDEDKAEKYNLRPAVGLAAPQVGEFVRIIMVMVDQEDDEPLIYLLANPKIIAHSVQLAALKGGEGCLSVEVVHEGYVKRPARVTIKAYDILREQEVTLKEHGYAAIVIQHEIDHLNGILFYDHIDSTNPWVESEHMIVIE